MITSTALLKKRLVLDLPERCPAWHPCHFTSKSIHVLYHIDAWGRVLFTTLWAGWEIVKKSLLVTGRPLLFLILHYDWIPGDTRFHPLSWASYKCFLGHGKIFSQHGKPETVAAPDLKARTGFTKEWSTDFCWETPFMRQVHVEMWDVWQM